jgi:hypothetical protein
LFANIRLQKQFHAFICCFCAAWHRSYAQTTVHSFEGICRKKILFLNDSLKIARDKWKHFFVGIAMGIVLQASLWFLFSGQIVLETVIAFTLVITISYGFELFSKFTSKGHYDIYDALAGIIGGVLGMIIILIIELKHIQCVVTAVKFV